MEHKSYFQPEQVLLDLEGEDKWAVLRQMVAALMENEALCEDLHVAPEVVENSVREREEERPTGLSDGFAFPHARIPGFSGVALCVALLKTPVDFEAIDKQPSHIVCLMVVPEEHPQLALHIMSQFTRIVADPIDRQILTSLKNPGTLCGFIGKRVLGKKGAVLARDIMRKPRANVFPETPLREVSRIMLQHNLDTIAVVDHDMTLLGEITCKNLFKLGMPDFFSQLKSVSFISEFDPFEKYFEGEGQTLARDVMSQDYAAVPDTATLLEVTFALAVKHHTKVHVLRDGKRVGAIDRILVLDRVINI